jgi:hypothetical protein
MAILNHNAAAAARPPSQEDQLPFYSPVKACQTAPVKPRRGLKREPESTYPSFAVIEIFAFNTFDTGQPFSAASAYF